MINAVNEKFLELLWSRGLGSIALKNYLHECGVLESRRGFKTQLANKTGFSLPYVGRVLEGRTKITTSFLEKLSAIYGADLEKFNRYACAEFFNMEGGRTGKNLDIIAKCFGVSADTLLNEWLYPEKSMLQVTESTTVFIKNRGRMCDLVVEMEDIINDYLIDDKCSKKSIKILGAISKEVSVLGSLVNMLESSELERIKKNDINISSDLSE